MTLINPPSDCQYLVRENGSLRAIIAELLITNQKLRWELQGYENRPRTAASSCCSAGSHS